MPVTTSTILEDRPQRDGRRAVRERHTLHDGSAQDVVYLAESGADVGTAMAARVTSIEAAVRDGELALNESRALDGEFVAPTFQHCTVAQARARIREIFKTAKSFVVCRLAWYIQRLGLTDNQLKAMFGVNDAQLVTLKAKLASLEQKYNDVQQQQGE